MRMIEDSELQKGIHVEQEHIDTYRWLLNELSANSKIPPFLEFCKSIAMDHIKEHPDYYDRLDKEGL